GGTAGARIAEPPVGDQWSGCDAYPTGDGVGARQRPAARIGRGVLHVPAPARRTRRVRRDSRSGARTTSPDRESCVTTAGATAAGVVGGAQSSCGRVPTLAVVRGVRGRPRGRVRRCRHRDAGAATAVGRGDTVTGRRGPTGGKTEDRKSGVSGKGGDSSGSGMPEK